MQITNFSVGAKLMLSPSSEVFSNTRKSRIGCFYFHLIFYRYGMAPNVGESPHFSNEDIYIELKRIARAHLRNQSQNGLLNTTVVVHEAYLKMSTGRSLSQIEETQFKRTASRAMRQVLIDHARKRNADKRGGNYMPLTLPLSLIDMSSPNVVDMLIVDDLIQMLGKIDPKLEDVTECRFFGGLTTQETAKSLSIPTRSVERYWQRARAYLIDALEV